MYWQPWTKIDVEVPVHEVGADDNTLPKSESHLIPALYRECAFLFFTQITLKTAPNGATKDKAINDISNENPDAFMASNAQSTDFLIQEGTLPAKAVWVETENLPDVSSLKFWIRSTPSSSLPPAVSSRAAAPSPLPSDVPAPSTSIFVIDVERWINAGEGQQPRYLNYPLGGAKYAYELVSSII
ncbi:hypothetical protein EYZ11_012840 [Aspergillus tanneri]|uniref:Neuraminidase-like domain-containing protein n=1 Tax=Aspergillus tanneri TaxID=1220188 RepID=A0A4S3IZP2_9EURO|nr:hypothetical protein EYZ11_012840 [Aspergillus tanneri]